jgi:protein-L-isoaspartate(D-aspartate) O-methyltransferase
MTTVPDFTRMTDAELFVLARLVQLREADFGPLVPPWVVELPLQDRPYSLAGDQHIELIANLIERELVSIPPEHGETPPISEPEGDGSTIQYGASDQCMQYVAELAAEIRRRSPDIPTELPILLLLFEANRSPDGFGSGEIRSAFEDPPGNLTHTEGLARYRQLMEAHWIFACDRPQMETEWFPAPRCWAHRESIETAVEARRSEMRERLAKGIADSLSLPNDSALRSALHAIDRAAFIPEPYQSIAYRNQPAPIWRSECGSVSVTTSSPAVCALIASTLELRLGDRVLVCGVKGGFTAALCASAVGPRGRVVCLEDRAEVVEHARTAIERVGLSRRIEIRLVRDVTIGLEDQEPWDAVVLNGKVPKVPRPIIRQMRDGGRMLLFLQNIDDHAQTAYLIRKNGAAVENQSMSTFIFTPIYGEFGFDPPNWTENLTLVGQEGHDVFVSYSTRDQEHCEQVVRALETSGIRCWQSARDHPVGKGGYETAIMDALRKSQLVLVLLSHDSVQSMHVQNELTNATNLRKPMLPVKLPECPLRLPSGFQYHLERYQQFDLLDHSLEKVVGAALTMLGATNGTVKPKEASGYDPGRMAETMAFVLRDKHVSRAEMQLLLEQARAIWPSIGDEELRRHIELHARELCPTAQIDA